ncbi:MAG: hypothetical protein K0R66_657 [Gammaproteobacteria bacterium]|jgi:DNA-binding CsgD family transcriptional regulator/PAS domain-containing protein|nr:hypothetical protein [Gammaproteobacteria bacterium]
MVSQSFAEKDYATVYAFANSLKLALIFISKEAEILDINFTACQLYGISREKLLNRVLPEFVTRHGIDCPISISQDSYSQISANRTQHQMTEGRYVEVDWQLSQCVNEYYETTGTLLVGKLYQALEPLKKDERLDYLNKMISSIPGAIYSKDLSGNYISSNNTLAAIAGIKKSIASLSLRDQDMPWCEVAAKLRSADQKAINQQKTIITEEYPTLADGHKVVMLSIKSPLLDDNSTVIGMTGISINISKLQVLNEVIGMGQSYSSELSSQDISLTPREMECVKWLLLGKSAQQIANILNISQRTVEAHFNKVKAKARCYKQIQLGYVLGKYGNLLL